MGLPEPLMAYTAPSYFERAGSFRPALTPRPISVLGLGKVHGVAKMSRAVLNTHEFLGYG